MSAINPYSTGGIVKDPAMFFGRKEELKCIRDRLRKGDSTAVVGLRRIGKSSLLYQLAHQADELPQGVVAIYLDLQEAAHHSPLGLLDSALRHLDERLGNRYTFAPVESLGDFSVAVKQIAADGYRPALCLDEFEELTERQVFDDDFFEALRSLGNQRQLAFATASGESLDVLLRREGRTSPFYNLFLNLDLAGLSDKAARALLTEPFQAAGLNAPPDEYMAEALNLAGHYPFYLQMAAYHLFEARRQDGVVNLHTLREAFARDAERHFRGLWRHLSADEQGGVQRLAGRQVVIQNWARTCDDLLRCGLAEGEAENPRLFSAVFAEMVNTGEIVREQAPRHRPSRTHPKKKGQTTPPLYSYALVALAAAVVALFVTLLLPTDRFWPFFVVLTVVLTFVLVLADKLTGEHFLQWLSGLLGKWS